MNEDNMIEVVELLFDDCNEELENAIFTLYSHKLKNEEAFYEINGVKIYSNDVVGPESVDEIFIKVYGYNYEEYVTKKVEEQKPEWIEKGIGILPAQKHNDWKAFVESVANNLPTNHIGNPVLEILELLPKVDAMEDEDEIKELLRDLLGSRSILVRALLVFSNKPETISRLYGELKRSNNF